MVATASRPESAAWARARGADHIIDHSSELGPQLRDIGIAEVDYVFCANATARHFPALAACMKPQGKICSIVDGPGEAALGASGRVFVRGGPVDVTYTFVVGGAAWGELRAPTPVGDPNPDIPPPCEVGRED